MKRNLESYQSDDSGLIQGTSTFSSSFFYTLKLFLLALNQSVKKFLQGPTPSAGAKSDSFRDFQRKRPLYNGRYNPDSSTETIAPPIEIFHPVFSHFLDDVSNSDLDVPQSVLDATRDLMKKSAGIYSSERTRRTALNKAFCDAISFGCSQIVNLDLTSPDDVALLNIGPPINESAALLVKEDKKLMGEGCDPTLQVAMSAGRFWSQPNVCTCRITSSLVTAHLIFCVQHKFIREHTCCPTLLVAFGGPWLVVMGSIFTDKLICQNLTDMIWLGFDRALLYEDRLRSAARVLYALARGLIKLQEYYTSLTTTQLDPLSGFFPSATSYYDKVQQAQVRFQYVRFLQELSSTCVTLLARTADQKDIVVKFVERYGEDAHVFLAGRRYAPALLYLGPIGPGPTYGRLSMVVMEYVVGETLNCLKPGASGTNLGGPVHNLFRSLRVVVEILHEEGFVFGDLRPPNIMVTPLNAIKLIDFDWAGKVGVVKYPLLMSSGIAWPSGATGGALITKQHDRDMIQAIEDDFLNML